MSRRKPCAASIGVEILALEVLDERHLELGLVIELADDRRDPLEAGRRGRAQPPLAGNQPVAVDRLRDEDRLQDAVGSRMLSVRVASSASSKRRRGWCGFGRMRSIAISVGPAGPRCAAG